LILRSEEIGSKFHLRKIIAPGLKRYVKAQLQTTN